MNHAENVYFIITWFKIVFIRHVKRRWEQFIENTLSLILEQISLKLTCVQLWYAMYF